jgi:hypothetical protein
MRPLDYLVADLGSLDDAREGPIPPDWVRSVADLLDRINDNRGCLRRGENQDR